MGKMRGRSAGATVRAVGKMRADKCGPAEYEALINAHDGCFYVLYDRGKSIFLMHISAVVQRVISCFAFIKFY